MLWPIFDPLMTQCRRTYMISTSLHFSSFIMIRLIFYHDTTYMNVDRIEMDRKLFAVLKPGGFLLIADHSALPGQRTSVGKTLHRIEESTLRQEVEAAGFNLVAEGNFWRNPADTYDYPSYQPTKQVDNFVLKFQKPM